jgi:hypothetical protein
MGDYSNGKKIGKHIILKNDGSTQIKEYKWFIFNNIF